MRVEEADIDDPYGISQGPTTTLDYDDRHERPSRTL
jgi:hypothetical protein